MKPVLLKTSYGKPFCFRAVNKQKERSVNLLVYWCVYMSQSISGDWRVGMQLFYIPPRAQASQSWIDRGPVALHYAQR